MVWSAEAEPTRIDAVAGVQVVRDGIPSSNKGSQCCVRRETEHVLNIGSRELSNALGRGVDAAVLIASCTTVDVRQTAISQVANGQNRIIERNDALDVVSLCVSASV